MPAGSSSIVANITSAFVASFGATFGTTVPINLAALGINVNFTNGTGAINTYQNLYAATLTLSTTPTVLNLANASLKNPDQTTITMADIVLIAFRNNGTAGQNVTIGGGTNAVSTIWGATGTEIILPGTNCFSFKSAPLATGFVVTVTTACNLSIVAAAGTPTLDLIIFGH